jgi:putative membrane protein
LTENNSTNYKIEYQKKKMISILSTIFLMIVGIQHVYIFYLENFLWQTKKGLKIFGMNEETAKTTAPLAKNMGLYNSFLAFGIFYSVYLKNIEFQFFFTICVSVAAIFGSLTANKRILYIQGTPAFVTLILLYFTHF